jgi:hypothetical protein
MRDPETLHALRDGATRALPGRGADPDHELGGADERLRWLCARCATKITDAFAVFGHGGAAPVQVFTNPAGRVCQVLTVTRAESLALVGPATREYSWFPGFAWRVALCAKCALHLGWSFEGGDGAEPARFFGLLVSALVEQRD